MDPIFCTTERGIYSQQLNEIPKTLTKLKITFLSPNLISKRQTILKQIYIVIIK